MSLAALVQLGVCRSFRLVMLCVQPAGIDKGRSGRAVWLYQRVRVAPVGVLGQGPVLAVLAVVCLAAIIARIFDWGQVQNAVNPQP